jgi:hypothetical protein
MKLSALRIVVIVALLLGAWVRTNGAEHRWVWQDEVTTLLHVNGRIGPEVDAARPRTFGELAAMLREPGPGGVGRVVATLVAEDTHHSPLYYVAQRVWNDAGGGALGRRSLSILIGALSVIAIGWFGFVLGGRRAGALAAALAAVSPFLVLYGQQMREYGLWCTFIALSSGAAVVAARRGGFTPWAWYAAASAAALWTSPLSVLLAPAHAVYAAYAGGRRRLAAVALAYAAALVAYAPWLRVQFDHRAQEVVDMSWSATPYAIPALAAKLLFTESSALTDLAYANRLGILASGLALLAIAAAVLYLLRRDRDSFVALGSIALTTAILPLLVDLVAGSHFSASSRYLSPLVVVTIVAVACALARLPQLVAVVGAAALVVLGAVSSAIATSSPVWWDNHGDSSMIEIASTLARDGSPPVLYEHSCAGLLGLARVAAPAERTRCGPTATQTPLAGWYVIKPSAELTAHAAAAGFKLVRVSGGSDTSEAVRAFRQKAGVTDEEPWLARFAPIRVAAPRS